ncbi:YhjD/YihY/BrkB family envelope integrity protein [Geobacter sp.]|uniref:YhjD/YihY/BrkB family envelope integrity protein n=1 Tax=Geobacter sp. TaxID=46610 RepID=UPI002612DAD2|nr:YhjD/YihY/BrkB family envelope integrity protein [Geobacter sp.]
MADNDGIRERIGHLLTHTIGELEPETFGPLKRRPLKFLQIAVIVCRGFYADQCLLRASALTFSTLLSIVPLFALAFAVLKGLGVQNTLEPFILSQVAAGSHEIVDRIVTYINNTKVGSLGAVGLAALLVTAVTLLGNIEEAFNAIWGVRETRSLYRKFSDYLSVLISGPLLLFAALSITTTLQSQWFVQWLIRSSYLGDLLVPLFHIVPYLSIWLALIFLYMFIPNTKVRFRSALMGGVIAGTLWQAAQWGYIHFQVGVAKYNAIYGTLAVLPVFMVWLYTSWLIVLFGVEVVYAHQHLRTLRREVRVPSVSIAMRERLALALMVEIARAFFRDLPPWSLERLAGRLEVPERIVREILDALVEGGWVAADGADPPRYLPARELEHIRVAEFLASLRGRGGDAELGLGAVEDRVLDELWQRIEGGVAEAVAGVTVRDLVATDGPGKSVAA